MEDDVYARAVFVGTGAYTPSTTEKHRRIELAKAVNYDPAFAHRAQKHSGLACCTMQRSRQVRRITYLEGAAAYPGTPGEPFATVLRIFFVGGGSEAYPGGAGAYSKYGWYALPGTLIVYNINEFVSQPWVH